jgi:hypothetical protein
VGTQTNIAIVENDTDFSVVLLKLDEGSLNITVDSNESALWGANVPWATTPNQFKEHRIEIQIDGVTRFHLWQREVNGRNAVRISEGGFENPGEEVDGLSQAGNPSRTLVIESNGDNVRLRRATPV